ncbi:phosphatidate cytidylyltransferase, mitochondrial-like [Tubulanus polymorphus]|uniref:phosphatidate cytidylyltransferase, mitochondrial-like n=1 Tax=Tubulanus polymorphus TaxID=672921 RepID=UPI003DA2D5F8
MAAVTKALVNSSVYSKVLSHFPKQRCRLAFAYGSGVFQQQGHKDPRTNMLDFIFVVDDPVLWHKKNMTANASHYSSLMTRLGGANIAALQDRYGAGIYFNTLVPCEERLIKYGVISTRRLITDLLDWDTLYVSGRMHKPVLILEYDKTDTLQAALGTNLQNALHAALLILPEQFTELQLYLCISGLSYAGDFRMTIGEDKNKVRNIVTPNIERFRKLYGHIIDKESHVSWNKRSGTLDQCLTNTTRYHHLNLLPKNLIENIVDYRNRDGRHRDMEEVIRSVCNDPDCDVIVHRCVVDIVKSSSISQSFKGIFTAGFVKSIKYSKDKLKKMLKSQFVKL